MNEKQRKLLIGIGAIIGGMLLFPPFHSTGGNSISVNFGYNFILSPPHDVAVVNIGLLFIQWLAVATVGFIGWLLLKEKN